MRKLTEKQLRTHVVNEFLKWEGYNETNGGHTKIINLYNSLSPLPSSYKMHSYDAWCQATIGALAKQLNLEDTLLPECSCNRAIALYQKAGCWEEDDSYVPSIGDLVYYDWQDSGTGDNMGVADHVGMVVSVTGKTSFTVLEGNYSNSVKKRTMKVNGKYIRGFALPDYKTAAKTYKTTITTSTTNTATKTSTTSSSAVKISNCTCELPRLKKGCIDEAVKVLQTILNYLGYNCGSVDGNFGSGTDSAVKKYQKAQSLDTDGIVGKDTWKALINGKK